MIYSLCEEEGFLGTIQVDIVLFMFCSLSHTLGCFTYNSATVLVQPITAVVFDLKMLSLARRSLLN